MQGERPGASVGAPLEASTTVWAPLPPGRRCLPPGPHLHGQDEAVAVQGVLPIQQAVQGQRSADVVQGEDAVGIPCKREYHSRCTWGPGQVAWAALKAPLCVLRTNQ